MVNSVPMKVAHLAKDGMFLTVPYSMSTLACNFACEKPMACKGSTTSIQHNVQCDAIVPDKVLALPNMIQHKVYQLGWRTTTVMLDKG